MRYVCKIYEDGTLYAYSTSDDGWKLLKVFEGKKPENVHRVSVFAEISSDNNIGTERITQALTKLQGILSQELNLEKRQT